jgi:multicomponent Na+:H+ antiporter subunit D
VANAVYYEAYNLENIVKPLVTIAIGWLAYGLIFRRVWVNLPIVFEEFENLIGFMSLILVLLFWMAVS